MSTREERTLETYKLERGRMVNENSRLRQRVAELERAIEEHRDESRAALFTYDVHNALWEENERLWSYVGDV